MKEISCSRVELFDFNPKTGLNIWEKNKAVLTLISFKAKGGGLIFDKEIKLKKAFDKAYDEFHEGRIKMLEAHSNKKKIVFLDGHEEETYLKVVDIKELIETSEKQLKELIETSEKQLKDDKNENLKKMLREQIDNYKKNQNKVVDDFGKKVVIKSLDGKEIKGKMVISQSYDLKNDEEFNKEFAEFLKEKITLECFPIRLSKLNQEEDCSALNSIMSKLEKFIVED